MAHENRIKVFSKRTTDSTNSNLNLDLEINDWVHDNQLKMLSVNFSTGRIHYFPGNQIVHFDIYATVLFEFPPSSYANPSNVDNSTINISNLDAGSAKVTWDKQTPVGNQKKIDFYLVYVGETKVNPADIVYEFFGKTSKNTMNIEGLSQGKNYTVKIVTLDCLMEKSSGSTKSFSSKDQLPPTSPSNLYAYYIDSTSCYLSWSSSFDEGTGLMEYLVYKDSVLIAKTKEKTYKVEKLEKETTYSFSVKAVDFRENESSPSSISVTTI